MQVPRRGGDIEHTRQMKEKILVIPKKPVRHTEALPSSSENCDCYGRTNTRNDDGESILRINRHSAQTSHVSSRVSKHLKAG